ncbi:hypothetical protein [Paenibacillus glucanolyticus]|uniref:hypothetical protein n=1 Tax=Paenibacillus glucanolyticus TaxID=59843 RepID=UPI0018D292D6|nr:hypothetical protein [Paenibacillus glucanolyticus]
MAHQSWIARALRTGTARELLLVPEKEWLLVVETDERMGRPPNGWCLHQVTGAFGCIGCGNPDHGC